MDDLKLNVPISEIWGFWITEPEPEWKHGKRKKSLPDGLKRRGPEPCQMARAIAEA